MADRRQILKRICCCPCCRSTLSWEAGECTCRACGRQFPVKDGRVWFAEQSHSLDPERAFHFSLLENKSHAARGINLARKIVTSEYRPRNHLKALMETLDKEAVVVECGSGARRLTDRTVNIDRVPFDEVDIVSDIKSLPLHDESVDLVVFDTVLEHVADPARCIDEARRVLKPGGRVACITPFVFPYHGFPGHYWNFSEDGLGYLFRGFSRVDIETDMGPASAIVNLVSEYAGLTFPGRHVAGYVFFKAAALLLLFPFKYLDRLWCPSGKSRRMAMCLYTLAVKQTGTGRERR